MEVDQQDRQVANNTIAVFDRFPDPTHEKAPRRSDQVGGSVESAHVRGAWG